MAEKPASKTMAEGPKLTQPKETLTPPAGEEQLATTVPGVPQFTIPTQA